MPGTRGLDTSGQRTQDGCPSTEQDRADPRRSVGDPQPQTLFYDSVSSRNSPITFLKSSRSRGRFYPVGGHLNTLICVLRA